MTCNEEDFAVKIENVGKKPGSKKTFDFQVYFLGQDE